MKQAHRALCTVVQEVQQPFISACLFTADLQQNAHEIYAVHSLMPSVSIATSDVV